MSSLNLYLQRLDNSLDMCYYTTGVYKRQPSHFVMLSVIFRRKLLQLGHKRHSVAVVLPKPLVDYLTERGHDFSDYAEIEVNDREELILRLNHGKN